MNSLSLNDWVLIVYGAFLLLILTINLLYFFQVFQYRLPGDASIKILFVHLALIVAVLIGSTIMLGSL